MALPAQESPTPAHTDQPYLPRAELLAALTPRERDVVERVAEGLDITEIARELGIGYQTTKMHLARAKSKLCVHNQAEVAILLHGGRPRSLPADPDHHPLRMQRPIARAEAWTGHLRRRVR